MMDGWGSIRHVLAEGMKIHSFPWLREKLDLYPKPSNRLPQVLTFLH